jgi:hypothetical protein
MINILLKAVQIVGVNVVLNGMQHLVFFAFLPRMLLHYEKEETMSSRILAESKSLFKFHKLSKKICLKGN